jgi:hypothetical protein
LNRWIPRKEPKCDADKTSSSWNIQKSHWCIQEGTSYPNAIDMLRKAEELALTRSEKRPRRGALSEYDSIGNIDAANDDCLVKIFSFLTNDQMNDAALVCHRFYKARKSPSLDQTRSATLRLCRARNLLHVLRKIEMERWASALSTNQTMTCLHILELERLVDFTTIQEVPKECILESITTLKVTGPATVTPFLRRLNRWQSVFRGNVRDLLDTILPNVSKLEVYNVCWEYPCDGSGPGFGHVLPKITSLNWQGYHEEYHPTSSVHPHITELFLDNGVVSCTDSRMFPGYEPSRDEVSSSESLYIFNHCPRLERLSIMHCCYQEETDYYKESFELRQDQLIKLVRCHPSLKWVRAHFTKQTMALLQEERPEVSLSNHLPPHSSIPLDAPPPHPSIDPLHATVHREGDRVVLCSTESHYDWDSPPKSEWNNQAGTVLRATRAHVFVEMDSNGSVIRRKHCSVQKEPTRR